jgi:LysM repeat protein
LIFIPDQLLLIKEIAKSVLRILLNKLQTWEKAGYLSPRIWGGLLVVGVVGVILAVQTGLTSSSEPIHPTGTPDLPPTTPQPATTPGDFEPLAGVEASPTIALMPIVAAGTPSATPTPPFTLHTVQEEETLISIAAHYDVTTEALLAANDIRDPTNLPVGQPLLIPPREGLRMPVVLHQVEPGDKLLGIASKYGSSINEILAANPGLAADSLPVGQAVAVPIIFNQPKPMSQSRDESEEITYVVQSGDIPLSIAAQFDVPVEILLAANDIIDPTRLQIGQELTIPPHEGITLGFPVILYELAENDTLIGLASKYGSSVKDILAVNPDLIPSELAAGQTVAIPIIFRIPKPTPSPDEVPAAPIEVSEPLVELEEQMVAIVNEVRQAAGLEPYEFDPEIANIAENYAQDMVVRDFFSHVSPEGITLEDRFSEQQVSGFLQVGENIQRNTRPRAETVQAALNWFMGSAPHRNNILHQYHNRIGVGIVEGPPGWYTIVLNFAQR